MKIKSLLILFPFAGLIFIASCGNEVKKSETVVTDSSKSKQSAEVQKLSEQIAAEPNNADLYHQRAKYYLQENKFDLGFDDMRKAMTIDSSKAVYFITLSDLYFVTNQTGNSKASLEKCLKLDDKNVDAMLKLAELYFYVKKHDKCFEYLNMALKIDKYNSKAYFMKGMNYKEIKDTAKAISSMQTAVEQDQTFYSAYMQLGILNAAQKNPIALDYYKNALRVQPNSTETWYNIGKYYQDVKNWNKAMEAYNVVLKIDSKNKNANYNIGAINLAELKDYKMAIQFFTNAISSDAAYVDAYYARGIAYQFNGDKKNALTDFQACLNIDPRYEAAAIAIKQMK